MQFTTDPVHTVPYFCICWKVSTLSSSSGYFLFTFLDLINLTFPTSYSYLFNTEITLFIILKFPDLKKATKNITMTSNNIEANTVVFNIWRMKRNILTPSTNQYLLQLSYLNYKYSTGMKIYTRRNSIISNNNQRKLIFPEILIIDTVKCWHGLYYHQINCKFRTDLTKNSW